MNNAALCSPTLTARAPLGSNFRREVQTEGKQPA